MRPYQTIKLTQYPDIDDICREGRRSHVGRVPRGSALPPRWADGIVEYADGSPGRDLNAGKVRRNDRGYARGATKARVRRYLKRSDRAAVVSFEQKSEK